MFVYPYSKERNKGFRVSYKKLELFFSLFTNISIVSIWAAEIASLAETAISQETWKDLF